MKQTTGVPSSHYECVMQVNFLTRESVSHYEQPLRLCMRNKITTLGRGKFDLGPTLCAVAVSQCVEKEGILDMARGNVYFQWHAWGYFTFKHLLLCSDDTSSPLVEKICNSMGFSGRKQPLNRQGPDHHLFFCAAFTLYYEEGDRGQTITAKNQLNRWFHTKKH